VTRLLPDDPGPFIASVDEVASLRRELARRDLDLAQAMAEAARHEAVGKAMAGEMERLREVNMQQASQLLDPDATCCADASRKSREMRLEHEAEVRRVKGLLSEALDMVGLTGEELNEQYGRYTALRAEVGNAYLLPVAGLRRCCSAGALSSGAHDETCDVTVMAKLRARLAVVEPVYEAAKRWKEVADDPGAVVWPFTEKLDAAIDAALAAEKEPTR